MDFRIMTHFQLKLLVKLDKKKKYYFAICYCLVKSE